MGDMRSAQVNRRAGRAPSEAQMFGHARLQMLDRVRKAQYASTCISVRSWPSSPKRIAAMSASLSQPAKNHRGRLSCRVDG
ncbi:hypothetical protein [Burkholderia diffusa]|uniref:hypothetical protein n=1 Tax=Burkholderia diffusa TaxID=488732 RepID=UPI0015842C71|nr:hypothetical protein [Burkholderia diffusa]